jgi:hypothetical protein
MANPIFDDRTHDMMRTLADFLLPSIPPGASKPVYDIVAYLENFLSAFDNDPPQIYAGGPFSNRDAPPGTPDNFKEWLPLTRYQRLAWRLRLHGGSGPNSIAGEPFVQLSSDMKNYSGLHDVLRDGLNAALQLSQDPRAGANAYNLYWAAGPDFRAVFPGLVAEAAFSAPEYGGNTGSWQEIFYPGDSLPAGHTPAEVTNATGDPFPVDLWGAVLLDLATIFEA